MQGVCEDLNVHLQLVYLGPEGPDLLKQGQLAPDHVAHYRGDGRGSTRGGGGSSIRLGYSPDKNINKRRGNL